MSASHEPTTGAEITWHASEFPALAGYAFSDRRAEFLFALAQADQWTWEIGSFFAPTGRIYAMRERTYTMMLDTIIANAPELGYYADKNATTDMLAVTGDTAFFVFVVRAHTDITLGTQFRVEAYEHENDENVMLDFCTRAARFTQYVISEHSYSLADYRREMRTYRAYLAITETVLDHRPAE